MSVPAVQAHEVRDTKADAHRPRPWRRRTVRGFVMLLVLLGVCLAVIGSQHLRQQQLIAVVRAAGGAVRDDRPLLERLGNWYSSGQRPSNRVAVNLDGADSDPAWLRKHDWLRGLGIELLVSFEGNLAGTDLARLIDAHPLAELYLQDADFTDEIVTVVRGKSDLECLSLVQCHLTNDQFAGLPLEQLTYLTLAGATLSPADLQPLERCRKLSIVGMDGRQFTVETAGLLSSLGTVTHIGLHGGEVTDGHLPMLQSIRSLNRIDLTETSVTPEAIAALASAMPECAIQQ